MILDKFVVIVHKFVRFRTRKSKNTPSAPKSAQVFEKKPLLLFREKL
mgnify:FL=1